MIKLSGLMLGFSKMAASGGRLFAADRTVIDTIDNGTVALGVFSSILSWLANLIQTFIYTVCKFALNIMDFFQVLAYKLIGVKIGDNTEVLDTSSPLFKFLLSKPVTKVFISLLIIAVVLIILFTIFAIVRSEYQSATNKTDDKSKSRIFRRVVRALGAMAIFPAVFVGVLILVNAILGSILTALNPNPNVTVGGNIFISSAYGANNYRNYALAGERIPILINFEDPCMYTLDAASGYTTDELNSIYSSWEEKGRSIYSRFAYNKFDTFSDTLYYKNGNIRNKADYNDFEKFVCTPEQYLVMADFIDYAVANNLTFYIKAYDDEDVDWGYVSDAVYSPLTRSFTIKYANSTGKMGDEDYYSITYQATDFDFDTPIQAALQSIIQILSLDEFSDFKFKMLERLDDGENAVGWKTEKINFKLSAGYKTNPTALDQLLLYEYSRTIPSNTLRDYTLYDLENGVDLKVSTLINTRFVGSIKEYVEYSRQLVCLINGSYYLVSSKEEVVDGKKTTVYELDPTILNKLTYVGASEVDASQDGSEDVVYVKGINKFVKLETDSAGKATLYADLRANFNSGDAKYDDVYKADGDLIFSGKKIYVDTIEDLCVTGTWTEKITNDLKVIYKDININNMINTDQWLNALGQMIGDKDYLTTEAGNFAQTTATFNTSLIHPLGLILSELFLGDVIKGEYYNSYADYIYQSAYDEGTIKALLVSLMGEDDYQAVYSQYQTFMELFNCLMSSVLDEVAFNEFFEIVSSKNQSIQLYTYKAYLASLMLSTDMGNYLYNSAEVILNANNVNRFILEKTFEDGKLVGSALSSYKEILASREDAAKQSYVRYLTVAFDKLTAAAQKSILDNFNKLNGTDYTEDELRAMTFIVNWGEINESQQTEIAKQFIRDRLLEDADRADSDKLYKDWSEDDLTCQEKARDLINTDKKEYDQMQTVLSTFNTVKSYWEKQAERNNTSYEYLDALTTYMTTGFARSWAFGASSEISTTALRTRLNVIAEKFRNFGAYDDAYVAMVKLINHQFGDEEDKLPAEQVTNFKNILSKYQKTLKWSRWVGIGGGTGFSPFEVYKAFKEFNEEFARAEVIYVYGDMSAISIDNTSIYKLMGQGEYLQAELNRLRVDLKKLDKDAWDAAFLKVLGGEAYTALTDGLNADVNFLFDAMLNTNSDGSIKLDPSSDDADVQTKIAYLKSIWTRLLIIAADADLPSGEAERKAALDEINADAQVKTLRGLIHDFVLVAQKKDALDQFDVSFAFSAYASQIMNDALVLNINNRRYTGNISMTTGKFAEIILGAEKLAEYGITPSYVDKTYKGILSGVSSTTNAGGAETVTYTSWAHLKAFVNKFGQACVDLSNKSSFRQLDDATPDELNIELYTPVGVAATTEISLSRYMAAFLVSNLSESTLASFIKLSPGQTSYINALNNLSVSDVNQFRSIVVDLLDYLGLDKKYVAECNGVDISQEAFYGFTLKQYRRAAMKLIANFNASADDTSFENQQRYLTLIYLASADWEAGGDFYSNNCVKWQMTDAIQASIRGGSGAYIKSLKKDSYAVGIMMRLSGLENRSETEIVGLKFKNDLTLSEKSEENGDVFVICLYDEKEEKYIPFLMANDELGDIDDENEYYKYIRELGYSRPFSTYLGGKADGEGNLSPEFYPVVAKGVFTRDGLPTAIKEVDGKIEFYRNDVTIVSTSKIGLSLYYQDASSMMIKGNIVNIIANAISLSTSGKTITELTLSKVPRVALESKLRFAYGNSYSSVASISGGQMYLDYNFSTRNGIAMAHLFNATKINTVVLVFSTIFMFMALFNIVWGLIKRIIDLTMLAMISPVMMATIPFTGEEKDKKSGEYVDVAWIYDNWLSSLRSTVLSVLGLSITLNIFFVLAPIIRGFRLFDNAGAFASLPLGNFLNANILNIIVQTIMLVCAITAIENLPGLFEGFIGADSVLDSGKATRASVQAIDAQVRETITGREFIAAKNRNIGMLQNNIPGANFMMDRARDIRTRRAENRAYKSYKGTFDALVANGVDPAKARTLASSASSQIVESQAKIEKMRQSKRDYYANAYFKNK